MRFRQLLPTLVAVLIGLLVPRVVWPTVLVPMSDGDLVASSSFIAVGEVLGVKSVRLRGRRIVRRVTLAVERVVKGRMAGDTIVVTVPGGRVGGRTVWVFGVPQFTVGERVLVFLRRSGDGTLRTTGMALGKYRIVSGTGGAERALRTVPTVDVRALDDFLARLDVLVAGGLPDLSARSDAGTGDELGRVPHAIERFTFLGQPPSRWFEPDSGQPVSFLLANSEVSLGSKVTEELVADSLDAWTNVSTASIVLESAGGSTPAPSVVSGECDGESKIQFNDPFGEIEDLNVVWCTGVFAESGFCAIETTRKNVGGTTFVRIVEGDVTVNDGIDACASRADITETVAHEIGHAIGLGHSSDPEALMHEFAHHDERGPELNADDILGLSTMYPEPDVDGDGVRNSRDRCPSTPPGFIVDANGCACTQAGSSGCDDGDACTEDSCDTATGGCFHNPRSCDDGEPCTFDCCDPATGGCINDLSADGDGDGLCDANDNCPLWPHADPTDLNGDGVGDVCQCADRKPGRCVLGRGPKKRRCLVEWMPALTPRVNGAGLPSARLRCTDGAPSCDEDSVPDQCTFSLILCVANNDPRVRKCTPAAVKRLAIKSPNRKRLKDATDAANAVTLAAAIDALLPDGAGFDRCGATPANRCSTPLSIVVPTRGARRGLKVIKVLGETARGALGKARLKLICKPALE